MIRPTFSVVEIFLDTLYKQIDSNFKITCNIIGTETPSSVKWSHKAPDQSESQEISEETDNNFNLQLQGKEAILTKFRPDLKDAGEFTCQFQIDSEVVSSATIDVPGPGK